MSGPLLEVRDLRVDYGRFRAVDGVSFEVAAGETLGLVGESGSGKTTIGRAVLRLVEPAAGSIRFEGEDVLALRGAALRALRRRLQVVFQDPFGSLDPRMRVAAIVAEGLAIHAIGPRAGRRGRAIELLERVGLRADLADRFPHELSGGQRQRVGIARALALEPRLVVLDECVSALDVSVQAQVLNLLRELQEERGLAYLFIGHDLAVVRHLASRVAVLRGGRVVECGPVEAVLAAPAHEYTRGLVAASAFLR
ncbi:MAG TPA: ATP-binding cassette domain-containing protein [Planctomycetota bacterium]|nr:ATP-binding cassette domain-containing protein [Planctomycetota bacterium]